MPNLDSLTSLTRLRNQSKNYLGSLLYWELPIYAQTFNTNGLSETDHTFTFKHHETTLPACFDDLINTLIEISSGTLPPSALQKSLSQFRHDLPRVSFIQLADILNQFSHDLQSSGYDTEACELSYDNVFQYHLTQLKNQLTKQFESIANTQQHDYRDNALITPYVESSGKNITNTAYDVCFKFETGLQQAWKNTKSLANYFYDGYQNLSAKQLIKTVLTTAAVASVSVNMKRLLAQTGTGLITIATFNQNIAPAVAVLPSLKNPIQTRYVDVGQAFEKILDLKKAFRDPDDTMIFGGATFRNGTELPSWLNVAPLKVAGRNYINEAKSSALYGDLLFVSNGQFDVNIFNISNSTEKKFIKNFPTGNGNSQVLSIAIENNRLYLGEYQDMDIFDLMPDPLNPNFLGRYINADPQGRNYVREIKIKNNIALLLMSDSIEINSGYDNAQIQFVNTTDPTATSLIHEFTSENNYATTQGTVTEDETICNFDLYNDVLFLALKERKIKLFNISDVLNPVYMRQQVFNNGVEAYNVFFNQQTNRTYAALGLNGISISEPIDFQASVNINEAASFDTDGTVYHAVPDNLNRLHLAEDAVGYTVLNIENFSNITSMINFPATRESAVRHINIGTHVYASGLKRGVSIYNKNPLNPELQIPNDPAPNAQYIALNDPYLLVASEEIDLQLFDLNLNPLGNYLFDYASLFGLGFDGNTAFLCANTDGIASFNISNPNQLEAFTPFERGGVGTAFRAMNIDPDNHWLYASNYNGNNDIEKWNISDPTNPNFIELCDTAGLYSIRLAREGETIYSGGDGKFSTLEFTNQTCLLPNPFDFSNISSFPYGMFLDQNKNEAHIGLSYSGLLTIDYSNPNAMSQRSLMTSIGSVGMINKIGDLLLSAGGFSITFLNYTSSNTPNKLYEYPWVFGGSIENISIEKNNRYIFTASNGVGAEKIDLAQVKFYGDAPASEMILDLTVWATNANREWISADMQLVVGPRPTSLPSSSSSRSSSSTPYIPSPSFNPTPTSTSVQTAITNQTSTSVQTPTANQTSTSTQTPTANQTSTSVQTPTANQTSTSAQTPTTNQTSTSVQTPITNQTSTSAQTTAPEQTSTLIQTSETMQQTNTNMETMQYNIEVKAVENLSVTEGDNFIKVGAEHLSISGAAANEISYTITTEGYAFYLGKPKKNLVPVTSVTQAEINKGWVSIKIEGDEFCGNTNLDIKATGSGSASGYKDKLQLGVNIQCVNDATKSGGDVSWFRKGALISVGLFANDARQISSTVTEAANRLTL